MPRKRTGVEEHPAGAARGLVERLAQELKSAREAGQPMIQETVFPSGKVRVTVIWDAWDRLPLEDRTAVIYRAYELAEGPDSRDKIALASGLTVPEAHAAGMLPFQIIPAVRRGDPVSVAQAREAMLEEGACRLLGPDVLQLRFPTQEEAEASRRRLIAKYPGSDDVWIINREVVAQDFARVHGAAEVSEE